MPSLSFNNIGDSTMFHKTGLLLLTLTFISISLSSCGTMHGAGQDLEHAGESVQDAAH